MGWTVGMGSLALRLWPTVLSWRSLLIIDSLRGTGLVSGRLNDVRHGIKVGWEMSTLRMTIRPLFRGLELSSVVEELVVALRRRKGMLGMVGVVGWIVVVVKVMVERMADGAGFSSV